MEGSNFHAEASGAIEPGKVTLPKKRPAPQRAEVVAQRMGGSAATVSAGLVIIILVQTLAIFYFVTRPPSVHLVEESQGKFYKVRGPVQDANVLKTLMEKFARRYVLTRETVNLVDDVDRFDWVRRNSSVAVWRNFEKAMLRDGFYDSAVQNETTWTIEIATVWQNDEANIQVWSLEIIKTHYLAGRKQATPEAWVVELKMDRDGAARTPEQVLDNPASLFVKNYSARPKEAALKGRDQ